MAFAKRIDELGFEVRETDNLPEYSKQMDIVTSDCSDYEKADALGLFKAPPSGDEPDIFDNFFRDHSIDIQTGELLGRYITEERDTGRMIADCASTLRARHEHGRAGPDGDRLAGLEDKLAQVCAAVTALPAAVAAQSGTNGRAKTTVKAGA
jgi:hypothetical protein